MANELRIRANAIGGKCDAGKAAGTVVIPSADTTVTDAVLNSTTTITSATANFDTVLDVGAPLDGPAGVPAGAYIQSVTNITTAVMNTAATATASGQTLNIRRTRDMQSPGLAALPAVDSGHHMVLVLDQDGRFGAPEIVYCTFHLANATWAQIARAPAYENTGIRTHYQDEDWVHTMVESDLDAYGLLGITSYDPGTLATYTTTSTTSVDIDATNLVLPSFKAPPSGRVLVRLTGLGNTSSAGSQPLWEIREGSSVVSSSNQLASNTANILGAPTFLITGLTPGSSHTYKWGWHQSGSGATLTLYAGGVAGPATMEVWGLNV